MEQTIQIILLCIGAALVCAMIRIQRPELAMAVSLAVGLSVLMASQDSIREIIRSVRSFLSFASAQSGEIAVILKAAGLTILCELGVQICCDAGESALAGRIRLACRIAILSMCLPYMTKLVDAASSVCSLLY